MKARRIPQRSCIGCRAVRDQRELLRIARGEAGALLLDAGQRLPGRGAYLCPTAACAQRALRPKTLERAFRQPVSPADLVPLQAAMTDHLQCRDGDPRPRVSETA